jgi:hypothetical protein
MLRRRWSYLVSICLAVGFPAASDCANAQDAPKRVPMTAEELAKFGIYLRFVDARYHGSDIFYEKRVAGPNKCYYETWRVLAVSDPLLKHFEERGFSLRTLCLALQSTLRYDGGTGKQLPLAVAARRSGGSNSLIPIEGGEILLNVPGCFKNGTPGIDCPYTYEWSYGNRTGTEECSSSNGCERTDILADDTKIRKLIQGGGYARKCGCSEIRLHKYDSYTELALPDDCNLDRLPACARRLVKDPDPAGRLIKKNSFALLQRAGLQFGLAMEGGGVDISASLPRGYGYSISTEGGDVEAEDVSLETLSKESGSVVPWNR